MNKLLKTTLIGIVFVIALGSILHFTYEWSGENKLVGLFSPVNESVWEHLKLLFFPYMLFAFFEYVFIGSEYKNYITAKVMGVLTGMIFIPIIFDIYTNQAGKNYLAADIAIFVAAVIISFFIDYKILKNGTICCNGLALIIMIAGIICFAVFTSNPPQHQLFLEKNVSVSQTITHLY